MPTVHRRAGANAVALYAIVRRIWMIASSFAGTGGFLNLA
jgi:hypothetical protein